MANRILKLIVICDSALGQCAVNAKAIGAVSCIESSNGVSRHYRRYSIGRIEWIEIKNPVITNAQLVRGYGREGMRFRKQSTVNRILEACIEPGKSHATSRRRDLIVV